MENIYTDIRIEACSVMVYVSDSLAEKIPELFNNRVHKKVKKFIDNEVLSEPISNIINSIDENMRYGKYK